MLQPQKCKVSRGGRDALIRGYVKSTNTLQGPATNTKEGKTEGFLPYIHKTLAEKSTPLYLYRSFLFSVHHLAIHYQPKNKRAQETNEQHEQEIQRCGARFKAQMIQALLYFTEGHSLGLYTSFIKLHLNWCSHPDSRNHHASFPFKRGNKYFICKAFCIRGSPSPSPTFWLIKPPRQTAAYPTHGLQRSKEVKCLPITARAVT